MRLGLVRVALLASCAALWILAPVTVSSQAQRALDRARAFSRQHLDDLAAKHGGGEVGHREKDLEIDERGRSHRKVQQLYRGVPVFGGEAIIHLDADGALESVTDDYRPFVGPVDTTPILTPEDAIAAALDAYGADPAVLTAPSVADLWVMRHDRDHLVYRVQLRREDGSLETALPVYFVDAADGAVLRSYDNLQSGSTTGTGSSLYSGTVSIPTYQSGTTYYLEDVTRKIGTFDFRNGTSSIYRFNDTNNVYDATNQRAAVDAHFGAMQVFDYYLNVHGRNGIDGNHGPAGYTSVDGVTGLLSSRVHYSTNYNNAFWNGQYMTYGDGDGSTFSPLVTIDIVGHEMTHGVIERTAGLVYSGESGALNESFADIFGAMIERHAKGMSANVWKIGEEAYTPANGTGDALRYLDNPHAAANSGFTSDDDPDHYSERYTGTGDNGGVHINSGISNKAFYLLSEGGAHHRGGSMTGIGADKAARIYYKALTSFMTSSTNFAGARLATINAANALYGSGSAEATATANAWCLVGVGSCPGAPADPPDEDISELIVNGGFETSPNPWVISGAGAFHTANGNNAHGGTGYAYFGQSNSVTGQTYQQISIPSNATSAALTFWLNVTSQETTTTTQYDKLFVEVRNAAGTLLQTLATYSNLNKVISADSYTQKGTFSLLTFKGQTIRVQFRVTTDQSAATVFRVDDVSVAGAAAGESYPTTTTLTAAPSPAVVDQAVTLAATVTTNSGCDIQGHVTFKNGTTVLAANVPLDGGDTATTVVNSFAAGTHALEATFSSSTSCEDSTGTRSLTVNKANQAINFVAPPPMTFGGAPVVLDATATSGLPVTLAVLSGPGTLDEDELTATGAGTIVVRATQKGNTDYNAATPVDRSIVVSKAKQAIWFAAPPPKTYGDPPFALSANVSSGLPVSFSVVAGPATIAGKFVTITGAGKVSIRAAQDGDDNYHAATPVDRTFDVAKAAQTIVFNPPSNKTYGDPAFGLSANASSSLPVSFSVVSGPATVAGKTVTITGAGKVSIRASQDGSDNYHAATPVDRTFDVAHAALTAAAKNATRGFWDSDPPFSGALTGVVPPDVFALSFATTAVNMSPAGIYPITVSVVDPMGRIDNYDVTTVPGSLVVTNPVPSVTKIAPNTAPAGSPDLSIEIEGQDFIPQSVARLNGAALVTSFVSRTRLKAVVPAASLATATVGFVSVEQGGPGGGKSDGVELLVTHTGAPVSDADTVTVDGGTGSTSIGGDEDTGTLTVTAEGSGSVTLAQFEDNPGPSVVFEATGAYFDVFVPAGSNLTSLTIVNCEQNGGNLVSWFDGNEWLLASNQTYDADTGCVTILVTDQTSPSLADLSGTYFAAVIDTTAPSTSASATAGAAPYVFESWTSEDVVVTLDATDNNGGSGLAGLVYSASGATSVPSTTSANGHATITVTADGETTIAFQSTDAAGNVETAQTRVVRIDRSAPSATAAASPSALWPPNGKPVTVSVTGTLLDPAGLQSARYTVDDEYGQASSSGDLVVAGDGSYRLTVALPASRLGDDKDGRVFTIRVHAADRAGNVATAETRVLVPHSQGVK